MAAAEALDEPADVPCRRHPLKTVLVWAGRVLAGLAALLAALVLFLNTGPGRQFIVDRIAAYAPASGLRVTVGRIEGSVLWNATLYDVTFRDARGVKFLTVPAIELNWRPYKFLFSGLDVRSLALHQGTLYAAPHLTPGNPNAPLLPNFDIRVDQFVIDDLTVAKGLLGEERHVDFRAHANIRRGLVKLDAAGEFGGGDRLTTLIDAEPDNDKFNLDLDYRAPRGGLLASLTGAKRDMRLRLVGDGTWNKWDGAFVARGDGERIAAVKLTNRAGLYRVLGQVWPGDYVSGLAGRALGQVASVDASGTLVNSVLDGKLALRGGGVAANVAGAVDLGNNAFRKVTLAAWLTDPSLFGKDVRLDEARLAAVLDGPFAKLSVPHELSVGQLDVSGTQFVNLVQKGTLTRDGSVWSEPLDATVERVASGSPLLDRQLVKGTLAGTLRFTGSRLEADDLALAFPGLTSHLTLRGDTARGGYALAGPVELRGLRLDKVGTVDAGAQVLFKAASGVGWTLKANFTGRMPTLSNATLAGIAGDDVRFVGGVSLGSGRPVLLGRTTLSASKLTLALEGKAEHGTTTLAGSGSHASYGPFTFDATIADDGPHVALVLAHPLPAAGLRDVHLALAPAADGYSIDTSGQSTLGPFAGLLQLTTPENAPARIAIDHLKVWRTAITGGVTLGDGGATGKLMLDGGGIGGTIALAPRGARQGFDAVLSANEARFGGATPLGVRQADVALSGTLGAAAAVTGSVAAQGISYGTLFVGRFDAHAKVADGKGTFDAALAGRRGSRFELQLTGQAAPERIALAARGSYGGNTISMPRRAVLEKQPDGAWQLLPTQLDFAGGSAVVEGQAGGTGGTQGKLSLAGMPLSLIDATGADLGLGGTASGVVRFAHGADGQPTGDVRVMVKGLTRSGLLLTSRPIDLALVAELSPTLAQARAALQDNGETRGRLQGRIANLPADGSLYDRLGAGDLAAQLRYDGPADALWRLAAVDAIDITGPVKLAADLSGTLLDPQVRGSLAGDGLRVQSMLTGSDVRQVAARGTFAGSRLQLTSFSGQAPNGGSVTGSGTVDLAGMSHGRGPKLDLRLAARNAQILDLATTGATVTGPLRIVSDGSGGTIAGRLKVEQARWRLGAAAQSAQLPSIATREINLPADVAAPGAARAPWRYLIDAQADDGVRVDGLGLDSVWSGNIQLRGTTGDPRIGGSARIVPRQGFYSFAGTRFEITRGIITFDPAVPPDPQIDLLAESTVNSFTAQVRVTGSASKPDIAFSSSPSLPEEEILAQLLFGGSIQNLSATDALQLGAAVASLRGGAGLDPINRLRQAVGLDRLRIVAADPALGHGTALALGKRFGRRFYAEIVTDGRGYNASSLEFRVTSWLSLLATVSSLDRESIAAEYRKDY